MKRMKKSCIERITFCHLDRLSRNKFRKEAEGENKKPQNGKMIAAGMVFQVGAIITSKTK
ncbi:MAG: hypothetical protein NTU98_14820 [Bacteroidetes bacterium]|nr:hypothetical protein [Bacteroidota bacterium]